MSVEDGAIAIRTAPLLLDLGEALHWREIFAPSLGELRDFLEADQSVPVLETSHGRFVKLLEGTPATFRQAVNALQPVTSAAIATYLVWQAGGVARAPLALLGRDAERAFRAAPDEHLVVRFTLDALSALPVPLVASVGGPVFFEATRAVLPDACRQLLSAARGHTRYECVLSMLGYRLGVSPFLSALMSRFRAEEVEEEPVRLLPRPVDCEAPSDRALPIGSTSSETPSASSIDEPSAGTAGANAQGVADEVTLAPAVPAAAAYTRSDGPDADRALSVALCKRAAAQNGLQETPTEASRSMQAVLQRAINRLAGELYAGNVHFVLELIQNADDNAYAADATPTLRMIATPSVLRFENNEVGFSERDCLALCSIGASTKKASDAGYIGNKGIGFKSVFKVTTRPEIHSGPYHLQFDKDQPLGYIVPQPLSPLPGSHVDGTCILLPLEHETADTTLREFRLHMVEIQPTLLLFLHRLRRLELVDEIGQAVRTLSLEYASSDIVTLLDESSRSMSTGSASESEQATSTSQRDWLVVREKLDARGRRDQVETTEIALAFPLRAPADEEPAAAAAQPGAKAAPPLPPLPVFAYLPLRSYGLKFLLQAECATHCLTTPHHLLLASHLRVR